ncbi:diphthine synthase [Pneumocystis murina B123]|uniref:diphthine methyl ester synthase n=1 Tax=Pneumocystis murina (strain B123) TaxID=1069680 RepID=M7NLR9_PNEMU|nr:diphthine synthase [Pneumocystis murina B123]EMR09613.1 diphthine synthase [Pneumocystis murina B123]
MLYLIGLGLADEKDISVKGLEIIRQCQTVYLEAYTSILYVSKEKLEAFYGCSITLVNREKVEYDGIMLLQEAREMNVALLVVGDPLSATTHVDLLLRARQENVPTQIVHNASIMTAIGAVGLQLYNFGQTVSLVFFTETWKPNSIYFRIKENRDLGLHTLILLDLHVQEPLLESFIKGKKIYKEPLFMSISHAIDQLLELELLCHEKVYDESTLAVGVSRMGSSTEKIVAGSLKQLASVDFGPPLHSLILLGNKIHIMEIEYVREFALDIKIFDSLAQQQFPSLYKT